MHDGDMALMRVHDLRPTLLKHARYADEAARALR